MQHPVRLDPVIIVIDDPTGDIADEIENDPDVTVIEDPTDEQVDAVTDETVDDPIIVIVDEVTVDADEVVDDVEEVISGIPTDHAALNEWIAARLGGYNRANFQVENVNVCIYQARGRQRIAWHVLEGLPTRDDFKTLSDVWFLTNADKAGFVVVDREGGIDTDSTAAKARRMGLWLVTVDSDGNLHRIVYPTPDPVQRSRSRRNR